MNTRAFTLALVISIIAMFMVYTFIEDKRSEIVKNYGSPVPVIFAKKDIKELELIDDRKIVIKNVPRKFALPGSFNSVKDLENTIATVPILKGEQITKPRVTYPDAKTGLSRQVSVGKRAIAIRITERQAASRLIKPGDRVDVISALDFSSGRKDMQSARTILQDVLVLSAGMSMSNAIPINGVTDPDTKKIKVMNANIYTKYNTVTLELDPYQVQTLVYLITYSGFEPYLSLRNNNDKKLVRIKSTDLFDVLPSEERNKAKSYFLDKYKRR